MAKQTILKDNFGPFREKYKTWHYEVNVYANPNGSPTYCGSIPVVDVYNQAKNIVITIQANQSCGIVITPK